MTDCPIHTPTQAAFDLFCLEELDDLPETTQQSSEDNIISTPTACTYNEVPVDMHDQIELNPACGYSPPSYKREEENELVSYNDWLIQVDTIDKTPTELFNATKNLVSLVYKHFNQFNIKTENSKKLYEFAMLDTSATRNYPLMSLTEHKWVMDWYATQPNQIANVNYPYWRNALQKKIRFHISRITKLSKK